MNCGGHLHCMVSETVRVKDLSLSPTMTTSQLMMMMMMVISDREMGSWLSLKERRIGDSEGMAMVVVYA